MQTAISQSIKSSRVTGSTAWQSRLYCQADFDKTRYQFACRFRDWNSIVCRRTSAWSLKVHTNTSSDLRPTSSGRTCTRPRFQTSAGCCRDWRRWCLGLMWAATTWWQTCLQQLRRQTFVEQFVVLRCACRWLCLCTSSEAYRIQLQHDKETCTRLRAVRSSGWSRIVRIWFRQCYCWQIFWCWRGGEGQDGLSF